MPISTKVVSVCLQKKRPRNSQSMHLLDSQTREMASSVISGNSKLFNPKPPAKGSFPLDHYGECKDIALNYQKCLIKTNSDASACHSLAKEYLKCRMEKDLMAKEDLKYLGFKEEPSEPNVSLK